MDEEVLVQELVNQLTFEVEPLKDGATSSDRNGTPLSVKVRVRNKNEPMLIQRGVQVMHGNRTIPERLKLIGSNQNAISFNVFMEATSSKESSPESRKRSFSFFKLGGCLGTSYDEDDGPYLPGSSNKDGLRTNRSSKSASLISGEAEHLPNKQKNYSVPRNEKKLFGKCKPGGCLDPPFDEDKYPYSLPKEPPRINLKQPLKEVADKKENNSLISLIPDKPSKESSKIVAKSENESKPVLNIFQRHEDDQLLSTYSNSIITYPPTLSFSQTQSNEQRIEKKIKNRSFDSGSARSSYEYCETYYVPPKDVRPKEEERRYSKELSNDKIKFDDDDRNKEKSGPSKIRKSIDKERTVQELAKNTRGFGGNENDIDKSNTTPYDRELTNNTCRFERVDNDIDNSEPVSHDSDQAKNTQKFVGIDDDIDNSKPDADIAKNIQRFGGIEDDLDHSKPMSHDTNLANNTRRYDGIDDDTDNLTPIATNIDLAKSARKLGSIEDNLNNPKPISPDTDIAKKTKIFDGINNDTDNLKLMSLGTNTLKSTHKEESDTYNTKPITNYTDLLENTLSLEGIEDDMVNIKPKSYNTDTEPGIDDDIDNSKPISLDTDLAKKTQKRYKVTENDIGKSNQMSHDSDLEKNTQRYEEIDDDDDNIDKYKLKQHNIEQAKNTRRFGEIYDDTDNCKPISHDTDLVKNTRTDDDLHNSKPTTYDKDLTKNTRILVNEGVTDKSKPKSHDADLAKNTRRFKGTENDRDNPHFTDLVKISQRFDGNENNIEETENYNDNLHDTDLIKNTRRFDVAESDINNSHDSDLVKNTQRFEEIENKPNNSHDSDIAINTRIFEVTENNVDNSHDSATDKITRRFEVNENDINNSNDSDVAKDTRRFEGTENDVDNSNDSDAANDTRRFEVTENDIDNSNDLDVAKDTRRFERTENDIDNSNDLDVAKDTRRFERTENDIDNSNDSDVAKDTRRFERTENDIDNSNDSDVAKDTQRFEGTENDIVDSHDSDFSKNTRRFEGTKNEPDNSHNLAKNNQRFGNIDDNADNPKLANPKPISADTDLAKNTKRFEKTENDIDNSHKSDLAKITRKFEGTEIDIDNSNSMSHDTDLAKNTRKIYDIDDDTGNPRRFAGTKNNINNSHDSNLATNNRKFGTIEHDLDDSKSMSNSTDTIKSTSKEENKDNTDNTKHIPYNTDILENRHRLGGVEDNIENSKSYDKDLLENTRKFRETDLDDLNPMSHGIDTMQSTRQFGKDENDSDKSKPMPYYTDSRFEEGLTDRSEKSQITKETKAGVYDGSEHLDDSNRDKQEDQFNTNKPLSDIFIPDNMSSESNLSDNKEFATSSIDSIHSSNAVLDTTKDFFCENTSLLWNENIQNERKPSDILHKTTITADESIHYGDIIKSIPLKRNTFTIIDSSRTSLQKQVDENSVQRNVTENLQANNESIAAKINTEKILDSGLRIMSSDTEISRDKPQNSTIADSLPYKLGISNNRSIEDASRNNDLNAELTKSLKAKNDFDVPKSSKMKTIGINISDIQSSTTRNHQAIEGNNVKYGSISSFNSAGVDNIPPDSHLKDESIDETIPSPQSTDRSDLIKYNKTTKAKTNAVNASETGSLIGDAKFNKNLISNRISPDKTNLHPRVLDDSTILVNLSFQSYLDVNKKIIIQTLNPLIKANPRYKDDTVTAFQSYIKNGHEIRLPVDPQHDLVLSLIGKHSNQENINKDNAEENQAGKTNAEDMLKKNLKIIYESGLIPLYSVIKDLIEEMNALSAQQEMLRRKMGRAERSKSLRLISVNNRCGCRKK